MCFLDCSSLMILVLLFTLTLQALTPCADMCDSNGSCVISGTFLNYAESVSIIAPSCDVTIETNNLTVPSLTVESASFQLKPLNFDFIQLPIYNITSTLNITTNHLNISSLFELEIGGDFIINAPETVESREDSIISIGQHLSDDDITLISANNTLWGALPSTIVCKQSLTITGFHNVTIESNRFNWMTLKVSGDVDIDITGIITGYIGGTIYGSLSIVSDTGIDLSGPSVSAFQVAAMDLALLIVAGDITLTSDHTDITGPFYAGNDIFIDGFQHEFTGIMICSNLVVGTQQNSVESFEVNMNVLFINDSVPSTGMNSQLIISQSTTIHVVEGKLYYTKLDTGDVTVNSVSWFDLFKGSVTAASFTHTVSSHSVYTMIHLTDMSIGNYVFQSPSELHVVAQWFGPGSVNITASGVEIYYTDFYGVDMLINTPSTIIEWCWFLQSTTVLIEGGLTTITDEIEVEGTLTFNGGVQLGMDVDDTLNIEFYTGSVIRTSNITVRGTIGANYHSSTEASDTIIETDTIVLDQASVAHLPFVRVYESVSVPISASLILDIFDAASGYSPSLDIAGTFIYHASSTSSSLTFDDISITGALTCSTESRDTWLVTSLTMGGNALLLCPIELTFNETSDNSNDDGDASSYIIDRIENAKDVYLDSSELHIESTGSVVASFSANIPGDIFISATLTPPTDSSVTGSQLISTGGDVTLSGLFMSLGHMSDEGMFPGDVNTCGGASNSNANGTNGYLPPPETLEDNVVISTTPNVSGQYILSSDGASEGVIYYSGSGGGGCPATDDDDPMSSSSTSHQAGGRGGGLLVLSGNTVCLDDVTLNVEGQQGTCSSRGIYCGGGGSGGTVIIVAETLVSTNSIVSARGADCLSNTVESGSSFATSVGGAGASGTLSLESVKMMHHSSRLIVDVAGGQGTTFEGVVGVQITIPSADSVTLDPPADLCASSMWIKSLVDNELTCVRSGIFWVLILVTVSVVVLGIITLVTIRCIKQEERVTMATLTVRRVSFKPDQDVLKALQLGTRLNIARYASETGWLIDPAKLTLTSFVAQGGSAQIYAGSYMGSKVAIKKVSADLRNENAIRGIVREILVMSRIRHPHCLKFFGCHFTENGALIVVEWGQEDLNQYIRRKLTKAGDSIPRSYINSILTLLAQVCQALDYIHSLDPPLVHRDIKPENILLRRKGHYALLSDFGIARAITAERSQMTCVGTPAYLSPEQFTSVSPASDVYSLGSCMFKCLTGHAPFPRTLSALQIMGKLQRGEAPSALEERVWTKHPQLARIVRACWAPNADDRPTAMALAEMMTVAAKDIGER
eukprot:gnl/Dysnectes_brevis/3017_a3727_1022.p1 GENE.gnl/Dysnectes_brevis/3017_a3727_1022~~gnl/Dysnectes_brevis/3017_a3727_1022.p1  ORF type:complete len:1318 (+),score=286.73 gnl/Dysnectes_brevis/3017_a3727_1022:27-3980(+)